MTDLPIKIRGLTHPEVPLFDSEGTVTNQEKAFIASSWSHKERANPAYFWVSKRAFHYQFYLGVIVPLIDSRPELFRVAYNTENPDQILGWACVGRASGFVYQHYVKDDFRSPEYGIKYLLGGRGALYVVKPVEFERLINDQRRAEVETDSVSGLKERTRKANQEHSATLDR